jgi:hypothetical protein
VSNDQAYIELIGDLQSNQIPPVLANNVLIVPSDGRADPSYTLLLQREQVSFTGQECNKVGVSYDAFNGN